MYDMADFEALVRDAKRYRFLRENAASLGIAGRMWLWDQPNASEAFERLVDLAVEDRGMLLLREGVK